MLDSMDEHNDTTKQDQEKAVKKAYGSRLNYIVKKSLLMAVILPILVIFTEQFILPHFFTSVEFDYDYMAGWAVLIDFIWMAAATFIVFALFHWLEWNQAVKVKE